MKKYMVLCAGLSLAMVFASCGKSSESAYKKAYEKAKSQEVAQQVQQPQTATPSTPATVTPVQTQPATQTTVAAPVSDKDVRSENVQLISGNGLKAYSVVVGSFKGQANAEGLQQQLRNNGYDAQVVRKDAVDGAWFRVIATTFDTKEQAINSRDALRATYQGAWLLFKQ